MLALLFMKYVSDEYAGKRDVVIQVPSSRSFADMDAEIDVLETRLANACWLQGVMQELLTERIRLVPHPAEVNQ